MSLWASARILAICPNGFRLVLGPRCLNLVWFGRLESAQVFQILQYVGVIPRIFYISSDESCETEPAAWMWRILAVVGWW